MSIESTVTQGLGISGGYSAPIGDTLTQGYGFGDDSIISDFDAEKISLYVWRHLVENGYTAEELLRGIAASTFGKISGMEALVPAIQAVGGSKVRIKMATDENGNRKKVLTLDLT